MYITKTTITKTTIMKMTIEGFLFSFQVGGEWTTLEGGDDTMEWIWSHGGRGGMFNVLPFGKILWSKITLILNRNILKMMCGGWRLTQGGQEANIRRGRETMRLTQPLPVLV